MNVILTVYQVRAWFQYHKAWKVMIRLNGIYLLDLIFLGESLSE